MPTQAGRPVPYEDPDGTPVAVYYLIPDDWATLRRARLQALADAPDAFLSGREELYDWSEVDWRGQFENRLWAVAGSGGRPVGVAGSVRAGSRPRSCHLESVWVAPDHRRQGIMRQLVEALIHRERHRGVTDVLVWVFTDNRRARRVYEHLGFVPTGERQPVGDPAQIEERLRLGVTKLRPG